MKIASRIAAALVAMIGLALVAPSPARASLTACSVVAGSHANQNAINFCTNDVVTQTSGFKAFWLQSVIKFDPKVTAKTTRCRVILRAVLETADYYQWSTPGYAEDCTEAVDEQDDGAFATTTRWHTYLESQAAVRINVIGCIDLYFNGSATSGAQWCKSSGLHTITTASL